MTKIRASPIYIYISIYNLYIYIEWMVLFFLIFSYKPVYFYTNTTLHLKNQNCPNLQNISERRTHFYLQLVSVYIADISTTRKPELSGTLFSFTQKEVGLCHLRIEERRFLLVASFWGKRGGTSSEDVFFCETLEEKTCHYRFFAAGLKRGW